MARLIDFTNKITNYLNAVWHYAVEDVGGAPKDGYIVLSEFIDYIKENVTLIQSRSFISPSITEITSSDSAVYIDTDLIVAITPKSETSKLRVNAQLPFDWDGNTNDGFRLQIQKKVGTGAWTDILYGNQIINHVSRIATIAGAVNRRLDVSINTQIDSPGITDEVQFKITFAPFTDTVTYTNARMRMITVEEILE